MKVQTINRLPKHDMVFGSPLNDPSAGVPLGDGDTGSLVWFEEDAIHININKTDLWEDSSWEHPFYCSETDEDLTCLRHGGELVIHFHSPCLKTFYQKAFEARLSLADATLGVDSETVFSHIEAKVFASAKAKTTAMRLKMNMEDAESPEIILSRWGSRNAWRWYSQMKNKPEAGLAGTEAVVGSNRIYIRQKLNGTEFCLGLALVTTEETTEKRLNGHSGCFQFEPSCEKEFTLFWNISLGKDVQEAQKNCEKALSEAINEGFEQLYEKHKEEWTEFWNTSYVSIPDDYIENCYYLSLYFSNSECRGAYPPLFTNGIWGFQHDYYPWAYYFHYNMQHMYGPLEPSGHSELSENYYQMRRNGLEISYQYAKEVKGKKGAFIHDVTDRYGRGANYDSHNCTPISQIAMAMWRHYRMNGDENFLKNVAFPVMKGAAEFYFDILEKGEDGLYHVHGTTAYEGTPLFHDTITDMVMIRALFNVMKDLVDEEKRSAYLDVLEHLPEYITVPLDEDEVLDGKLTYGIGLGKEVLADGHVFAVGFNDDGIPMRRSYGDPHSPKAFYGFPDTEMSPIYPAGIMGIADKGTRFYDVMVNQVRLHHKADECMQWCMMPLYLARMGMAEELPEYLRDMVSLWLIYPNGFGSDGPDGRWWARDRFGYNKVSEYDTHKTTMVEAYQFRHYNMETLPIVAHAVCESLLQSYDGILRICPAIRKQDPVEFCLYAEGGFRVSAEVSEYHYSIMVEFLRDEECLIKLPDYADENQLRVYCMKQSTTEWSTISTEWVTKGNECVLRFADNLKAGDKLLLTNDVQEDWNGIVVQSEEPNKVWKTCGKAQLGTPPIWD